MKVSLLRRIRWYHGVILLVCVVSALFLYKESLTRGGMYSLSEGFRYSYSLSFSSREDALKQIVYKSVGYYAPGIEYGGGWGARWDKIDKILPKLNDNDIPILIGMIDKDITLSSANGKKDISNTIVWILSRMNRELVVSQLQGAWQINKESYYLDYGLQLTMSFQDYLKVKVMGSDPL